MATEPRRKIKGGMLPAGMVPSGEMSSYTPTVRERMTDYLRSALFSDDRAGQAKAERLMSVGDSYGLTLPADIYEATREAVSGRPGQAGMMLGMAMLPGPSPRMGFARTPSRPHEFAHGSPDYFETFDPARVGTGAGQAFGKGLYGAEDVHVAESWAKRVATDKGNFGLLVKDAPLAESAPGYGLLKDLYKNYSSGLMRSDRERAAEIWNRDVSLTEKRINELQAYGESNPQHYQWAREEIAKDQERLANLQAAAELVPHVRAEPHGYVYKMAVDAPREEFIHWNTPYREQPERVKELVRAFTPQRDIDAMSTQRTQDGLMQYALQSASKDPKFSRKFPGVRLNPADYKTNPADPHNVIVWNPETVRILDILKKFAIPGMLGYGMVKEATDPNRETQ